jgi:hypothetical protein
MLLNPTSELGIAGPIRAYRRHHGIMDIRIPNTTAIHSIVYVAAAPNSSWT